MIYITGDVHGGYEPDFKKFYRFDDSNLSKNDYMIVAGDFGYIWEKKPTPKENRILSNLDKNFNFTWLFIDGNHENHDRLNAYEVSEFAGGRMHKIHENIYHLMRGEIYEIDGKKIFTMGGAMSVDREFRKEGSSWWAGEAISQDDMANAWRNLEKHDFSVDIVITHTCPRVILHSVLCKVGAIGSPKFYDKNCELLDEIHHKISFKKWYFGHFHGDVVIDDKFRLLYQDIVGV